MQGASASVETAHRADIQGLRAIAVLSVVLYHAAARLMPGGFVGVDIFFVISGFLITGILVRELERGRMSIAGFYQRRVRRLFPALFVMLGAALAAGMVLLAPQDFSELARTTISTLFFVSNFDFFSLSGYFDGAAEDKPLLHTWSLAVEEQFYIFFPLLLALLWTHLRRHLALIVAAACALGLALSAWGAHLHPTAAFYLTPFRAFELAMGALVALRTPALRQWLRHTLSIVGLVGIGASFALYRDGIPFPGLAAFVPCLGTALVIMAGTNGRSIGGWVLSFPVLTFFGAISYSLYLWHWPVLAFARHHYNGDPSAVQTAVLMAFAAVAATASYLFVEQPMLKRPASRRAVFGWGAGAMAVTTALAAFILVSNGAPSRFPPRVQALFAANNDFNQRRNECHSDEDRPIPYARNCTFGAAGVDPVVALWGDSAGAELVVALGEALERRGQSVMEVTSSACPPALDYQLAEKPSCIAHNRETLDQLMRDRRIGAVVLSVNFARYPDRAPLYAGYARVVRALQGAGKTVVLAYPFPNPWFESPRVLGLRANRGEDLDSVGVPYALYAADNADAIAFLDALARDTGAVRFHLVDTLCDRAFCHAYLPQTGVLYFNGNHISVTGARLAVRSFPFAALPPPAAHAEAM